MRYSTFLAILLAHGALAQPVLNFPVNAPSPAGPITVYRGAWMAPGAAGANLLWDFSGATPDQSHTIHWVDPLSVPGGAFFGNSTVARTEADEVRFFRAAADGFHDEGELQAGTAVVYDDEGLVIPFPCGYQTSWWDDLHAAYLHEGALVERYGLISGRADAYGTLVLPTGTVPHVLRIHWQSEVIDHCDAWTVETVADEYLFFVAGSPHPLVRLVQRTVWVDGMSSTTSHAEWSAGPVMAIGDVDGPAPTLGLHPVPARDHVFLTVPEGFAALDRVVVRDAQGRQVLLHRGATEIARGVLDIAALSPGTYLCEAVDQRGQRAVQHLVVH